ncbi:MAG: arginine--tRNA ligase, partial [Leptospira sp.]|nr:arginine--tRNA ligase [Leptospira sp.]
LNELKDAIHKVVKSEYPNVDLASLKIRIEYSRDEKFGDYSTPFALENKGNFGGNPKDIAEKVLKEIKDSPLFQEVSFSPPGFLNFRISTKVLISKLFSHFHPEVQFGEVSEKKNILLEFVSANPTGPMNIVSARSAAYGDALANLLSTLGHTVHREFYVNDYGNQVYLLGVALLLRIKELSGQSLQFLDEEDGRSIYELIESNTLPKESYRGEYIKDIAKEYYSDSKRQIFFNETLNRKTYDELIHSLAGFAVHYNLERQKEDLKLFGVHFDTFFSEKYLHDSGKVADVPKALNQSDLATLDGKLHFLSTNYGDDKDRVILREDGRPTYLMADIAYHANKFERGYETLIDIWGPDHYGYIARLKGAISSLGKNAEDFIVLIAQQVNLIENKEKVKMSKRLGIFQTMRDLLAYLGKNAKDVGRYFFLMRSSDAPLDFDLDLAKDESDKNPVYYIQYAHARICSIFRELQEEMKFLFTESEIRINDFATDERARLLFWICRFQEEVFDTATSFEPHRLTNYLQSLSKAFTKFYSHKDNRIKDKTGEERRSLLCLILGAKLALENGLKLLGISAPNQMSKEV